MKQFLFCDMINPIQMNYLSKSMYFITLNTSSVCQNNNYIKNEYPKLIKLIKNSLNVIAPYPSLSNRILH